jgi:glycosyltransferase involved in cell wall biosynthesis
VNYAGEDADLHAEYSGELTEASSACSGHPLVSVVLCTNKVRRTLVRCLEMISAQDCRRYEIVIVLNGPVDDGFAQLVSPFPVTLLNEPRQGVCIARNHAIPRVKGEILVFVDDDISVEPNWLHKLIKGFEDPRVACVTGRVIPEGKLYLSLERATRYYSSERALSDWTLDTSDPDWYQNIMGQPVGFGCNMAFRRSFLERYECFPPDLGAGSVIGGCDEFYMFLQVLKHGFRMRHIPSAAASHFFEADIEKQKLRSAQLYAGSVAFALKLLVDERTLRWATLKWLVAGLNRRAQYILSRKGVSSEPQELLSPGEKVRAYLRGVRVFWMSRRMKNRDAARP